MVHILYGAFGANSNDMTDDSDSSLDGYTVRKYGMKLSSTADVQLVTENDPLVRSRNPHCFHRLSCDAVIRLMKEIVSNKPRYLIPRSGSNLPTDDRTDLNGNLIENRLLASFPNEERCTGRCLDVSKRQKATIGKSNSNWHAIGFSYEKPEVNNTVIARIITRAIGRVPSARLPDFKKARTRDRART